MKNSIKIELESHLSDLINDNVLTNYNKDEWHFHAFNEDYYLIGYFNCNEWLKLHNIGEFEAADICNQYEIDIFGETSNKYDNSESVVNMLAYIFGEELLCEIDANDINELKEAIL